MYIPSRIMATPSSPGPADDVPSEQVRLEQPLVQTPEACMEVLTAAELGFSLVAYQRLKILGCSSQFIELMALVRASLKG